MEAQAKSSEDGNKLLRVEIVQGELVSYLRSDLTDGELTLVYAGPNPWRLFVEAVLQNGDRICITETQHFQVAREAADFVAKGHAVEIVDKTEIIIQ